MCKGKGSMQLFPLIAYEHVIKLHNYMPTYGMANPGYGKESKSFRTG